MSLKTFIKPITWLPFSEHGYGNGYVVLPKDHPMNGKHYDEINEHVEVHGGLTFSEYPGNIRGDTFPEMKELEETDYVVGFDTCHAGDTQDKWTKEAVKEETENLKNQLEELYETAKPSG